MGVVLAVIGALTAVALPSAGQPAAASTDIDWFVAAPGVIRTNLEASHVEYDPATDLLYAVTPDPSGSRVVAVDATSIEIVAEHRTTIPADFVFDIAVSPDGDTLFVLSFGLVTKFRTGSLEPTATVPISGATSNRVVVPSPTLDDRFALVSQLQGSIRIAIYDDDLPVDMSTIEQRGTLGFGATDDVFFIAGGSEWVERYEFSPSGDSVSLVHRVRQDSGADDWRSGRKNITLRNGQLLLVQDHPDIVLTTRDPVTLSKIDETVIVDTHLSNESFDIDLESGRLVIADDEFHVAELDDLGAGVDVFRAGVVGHRVTLLSSGEAAVIENRWMTILSIDLLVSGFGEYQPLTPSRVLDTRVGLGVDAVGPIAEDATRSVRIAGAGGVPSEGALAVVLNATAVRSTESSYLTIAPSGVERPLVSNLNFVEGETLANSVTVPLGEDGSVDVYNRFGEVHVVLDVVGFYSDIDGPDGSRYVAQRDSIRLADTRSGEGVVRAERLGPGDSLELSLTAVDRTMTAAVLNVVAVNPTEQTFLTVHPTDARRPTASSLNAAPGDVRPNLVVSKVSADTSVTIYNDRGHVDIVVDVFGYYRDLDGPVQDGRF
ncbi:MAG: hypothetical protein AAF945_15250, partial [Actinomycetota bacterium]